MASNEFDALLADLAVVDQIRRAADLPLAKSLTLDSARQALAKIDRPERRGPLFRTLPAHLARSAPRRSAKVDVRAKAREVTQDVMNKAMSLFEAGKINGLQIAQLEAKIHALQDAAR